MIDTQDGAQPLYSEEWITLAVFGLANTRISNMVRLDITKQMFQQVIGKYEAERTTLTTRMLEAEAQLTERGGWEVGDFQFTYGAATIGQIGNKMYVNVYGETLQVELPLDLRLCRRTTASSEGANQ